MSETQPQPDSTTPERKASNLWIDARAFLKDLLDIRDATDHEASLESIRNDIPMQGHTAWILIFAIIIASIGLNIDSTAVVIGAMLISPLMGPIMGLGMGVAINDAVMLRRSLINLAVMIGLSVFTAFIYFKLSPLKDLTPELESRTYPTLLDVLVAISGGLALIIGRTKKGTIASVLVGVAIATALMPPLCTAGYGLATWGYEGNEGGRYFWGSMYLFSINTVYIGLSAYLVARLLRFPMAKYANSSRRRLISRWATAIGLTVLVPSLFLFTKLLQEQFFIRDSKNFVNEEIDYPGTSIYKSEYDFDAQIVDVYLLGKVVPDEILESWQDKLRDDQRLELVELRIHQGVDQETKASEIQKAYVLSVNKLNSAEDEIDRLKKQVVELESKEFPAEQLFKEVKAISPSLQRFSVAQSLSSDFSKVDTLNVFNVTFWDSISTEEKSADETRIRNWLLTKLNLDTLVINSNIQQD
ncbi:MAG: DUF389 domain-containing protein [Bacteroidia bacterium]|nr:DUF389 domain-containing protein [Bacteroidia bacterium]